MKKILNIMLGILMVITAVLLVYAIATGGSDAAISANLMWSYFLLVFGIAAAIFCAVFVMIQNPAGIKGTILSLALIIVVVGVSYFIAAGHTVNIVDLQNNDFFPRSETVITETSVLVAYVAVVTAFLTAVVTEIWGAFK